MPPFRNRYMVVEAFLDPNRDFAGDETIILTQFNVSKAIKDSIQFNFGKCGLASSLGSFHVKYVNPITQLCIIRVGRKEHQMVWSAITMVKSIGQCPIIFNLLDLSGSLKVCKTVALKCEEAKFEHYKLTAKDGSSPQLVQEVHNYFEKIKALET